MPPAPSRSSSRYRPAISVLPPSTVTGPFPLRGSASCVPGRGLIVPARVDGRILAAAILLGGHLLRRLLLVLLGLLGLIGALVGLLLLTPLGLDGVLRRRGDDGCRGGALTLHQRAEPVRTCRERMAQAVA